MFAQLLELLAAAYAEHLEYRLEAGLQPLPFEDFVLEVAVRDSVYQHTAEKYIETL